MSDTDACNERDKPPDHIKDSLNKIWETMQKEEVEREGIRRETEERQETNRKKDKERLEELIKQISEDVEKIKKNCLRNVRTKQIN
jgi:leucyl-tRNA synthetase